MAGLKPELKAVEPATATNEPDIHPVEPATATTPPDPFDLDSLSLSQNFLETAGVKKLLRTVPTRKSNPQDFVRVHPSPDYRRDFLCLDLKDDRELYLVRPEIAPETVGETVMKTIYTAINRQGVVFLWPVTVPPPDGRQLEWWRSMREAAELAMTSWIRVKANMSLGAYEMFQADGLMAEPEWPDISYQDLLKIGFRDRMIDRVDHPVIKRLRGLA
jgi:hypothetical protein